MALKKYVPRSIQNIFDRLEAFNESITAKLFSEDLAKTFEVIVYCTKNPETKTSNPPTDNSTDVANYNFYKARSTVGHHDHLVAPEKARSIDEYERLRNMHFQATLQKSQTEGMAQTGDIWLATQTGAGMVSLISKERSGNPNKFKIPEGDGPALSAHTSGQSPTTTVGNAAASASSQLVVNMMDRNKKSRDILKQQLKTKFEAAGLTFHVTSEVRNIDKQVSILKGMYDSNGRDEVLVKYGSTGTGKEIVDAIESNNEPALKVAAQKSTRHLRGLAIDVRTRNLTDEQVNKAIDIVKDMRLTYIIEPLKTNCWDKPGKNTTNVKRIATAGGPNRGDPCYGEHMHISIPEGYGE